MRAPRGIFVVPMARKRKEAAKTEETVPKRQGKRAAASEDGNVGIHYLKVDRLPCQLRLHHLRLGTRLP